MTVYKKIDLGVYSKNLERIIERMAPAKVMAVIKADGYGHGLIETAKTAEAVGVAMLGVLDIETGLAVRKSGVLTPAFAWLHSPQSDFELAVKAGIELSVGSLLELEKIARVSGCGRVHLKIDTGLSRNGCRPENWNQLVTRAMELQRQGELSVVAIWSHLAGASEAEDLAAIELFKHAASQAGSLGFTGYLHIASSPAAFAISESRFDLVRIGVSAFGTSPVEGAEATEFGLESPMSVTCEVLAPGVISIGFLHGYFSQLSGLAKVQVGAKEYRVMKVGPLASKIETGEYLPGDEVKVFGTSAPHSAEELCELVGTVTDELFTGLKANSTLYSN